MKKIYALITAALLLLFYTCVANGQTWDWAAGLSCGDDDYPVATDANGNIYKLVYYACSNNNLSTNQIGIYKFDSNGNVLSAFGSSSGSFSNIGTMCTDDSGNVYAAAIFSGTVGFGSYTITSPVGPNSCLVKYNSAGNVQWLTGSATSANNLSQPSGLATDRNGNIYLAGQYADTISFGIDTLKSGTQYFNFYLVKYNRAGNVLWAKSSASSCPLCYAVAQAVATDRSGNIYLTGIYYRTISIGSYNFSSGGPGGDVFIVKYDSSGNLLWAEDATPASDHSNAIVNSIATDGDDHIYLAGDYTDTISFGGKDSLTASAPGGAGFMAKFDSAGRIIWDRAFVPTINANGSPSIYSIVLNKWGSLYVSGGAEYSFIVDNTTINPPVTQSDGAFIARFDTSGKLLCYSTIPTGGDDANALAADPLGPGVYFSGDAANQIAIFGNDTVNEPLANGEFPVLAKWEPCKVTEGIAALKNNTSMSVFPNPFHNATTILVNTESNHYLEVDDLAGRKIESLQFIGKQYELSAQGLAKGMYFVRVFDAEYNLVGIDKIVVQ